MAITPRVDVDPALLEWACNRSGVKREALQQKFRELPKWLSGEKLPTEVQLQSFANATFTPFGSFFSETPPADSLPVSDFRVRGSKSDGPPSPHLLDTVYNCQEQQAWYRDYLQASGESPLDWVGSQRSDTRPNEAAAQFATMLGFDVDSRSKASNWEEGLRVVRRSLEEAGVLVMINGVVGNNTRRPLDPEEFNGFALADKLAPLVFVNNTDFKASQMFTIAHEVGHLLLGESGVSDDSVGVDQVPANEAWCDLFAAELLVPEADLGSQETDFGSVEKADLQHLASRYKVSKVVVLRRLRTANLIGARRYFDLFLEEREEFASRRAARDARRQRNRGGNFYSTFFQRNGRRFAGAVVASTLEGRTTYDEMSRLLGISTIETFEKVAGSMGFPQS